MAQGLGALAVLVEDQGSIPSITWWLITIQNSSSGDLTPSFEHRECMCTHTSQTLRFLKKDPGSGLCGEQVGQVSLLEPASVATRRQVFSSLLHTVLSA